MSDNPLAALAMRERADWFAHANPAEVAQEYLLGPQDLDEIKHGVWGHKSFGAVCLGNHRGLYGMGETQ